MAEGGEQNRSEEATPFKLRRARERGQVARSPELGFIAGLVALVALVVVAGPQAAANLSQAMRISLAAGIGRADDPAGALALVGTLAWSALQPVVLFGGTLMALVLLLEIVQLRGLLFSAHPLKPDFTRLNPAKGLKRVFSARMLKETAKSLVKAAAYATATWLVVRYAVAHYGEVAGDGERLTGALRATGLRLLVVFILVALPFVALDQLMVRRAFAKQMRMSRREVTRENREREGEPRLKRRRRELHADFARQAGGLGRLAGSDLLVVNPTHYAVALRYVAGEMAAPEVTAKGRNKIALLMKERAFRLGIPIVAQPVLARALFAAGGPGRSIPPDRFAEVADLYLALYRDRRIARPL